MVQIPDDLQSVVLAKRAGIVGGLIADLLNDAGFLEDGFRQEIPETGIMNQGSETRVVGHPEAGVVAVEPVDSGLQCEACMEAGGAGIAHDVPLRLAGGFRKIPEACGEKGEVAHVLIY